MAFETIIGQKRICELIGRTVASQRTSHAYLLAGEKGVGKEAIALEFAKLLLCPQQPECQVSGCVDCQRVGKLSHPDLHFIFPAPAKLTDDERLAIINSVATDPYQRAELWANPTISIDTIRELRKKASFTPFEGGARVVIVVDCERMTIEAANSVLKILEEPPAGMYLIMTSSRPNLLLPTITSRCQSISFDPLPVDEIKNALMGRHRAAERIALLAARMSGGSFRRALAFLAQDIAMVQNQALEFFRLSVQDDFRQSVYVDKVMTRTQRDTRAIKEQLTFLSLWFRDAMVFKETGEDDKVALYYSEDRDILRKFTESFPNADLFSAVGEIEYALGLFDRNIQAQLILIVLLAKLRSLLRR
jgi:DNA polymerase-3 subunit delta'